MKLCTVVEVREHDGDVATQVDVVEVSLVGDDHEFGRDAEGKLHIEGSLKVASR